MGCGAWGHGVGAVAVHAQRLGARAAGAVEHELRALPRPLRARLRAPRGGVVVAGEQSRLRSGRPRVPFVVVLVVAVRVPATATR